LFDAPMLSTPLLIVVVPPYVLTPPSTSVPPPTCASRPRRPFDAASVIPPVPANTELIVAVNVGPTVMFPAAPSVRLPPVN
jgi:hypothetical protein